MEREREEEVDLNLPMFFGFVGLINMLLAWPIVVGTNVESCRIFNAHRKMKERERQREGGGREVHTHTCTRMRRKREICGSE